MIITSLISEKKWFDANSNPTCTFDYAVMALAQHYGIPTHGLDVTTSLDVALWFSVNKFTLHDQMCSYKTITETEWPEDPEKWPVIFVLQTVTTTITPSLHSCHELDEFGIKALRPERQHAKFFLGGHNDHQNRLAEAVVCVLRLKPGVYNTASTFEYLFPDTNEDAGYNLMSEFATLGSFHAAGSDQVQIFHRKKD